MPTLDTHISAELVKALMVGESGSGKSGALAALAKAGYRLWILDFDGGVDILANILRADAPEALRNVTYETLEDKVKFTNGVAKVSGQPTAYKRAGEVLNQWKADEFTSRDVLVLDTLMTFSTSSLNHFMFLDQRLQQGKKPTFNNYGAMADSVLLFIDALTAADMHCHVIVNTHLRQIGGEADEDSDGTGGSSEDARWLPSAKGRQIPENVAKYFNNLFECREIGTGPGARRYICTQSGGTLSLKTSNPGKVKPRYGIENGLAELFKDILGHGPGASTPIGVSTTAPPPAAP